jgi:signal transduction histidine kinase
VSIVAGGKSAQGEPSYILTLDDVTELKRREQKLFDLQIAADRGKMASTIAHELNNFLTLLLGGVELLGIAVEDGNAHKVRETMGKLRDQVTNLERFTRDLSDVTSIGSSRRALDLNALINDVVSFISVQKRFRGLKIVRDLGRIMPSVAMDKDQITQVLLNLLTNAADAIAESKRTDGLITIATTLDRDGMELRVSDNGPGLKPGVEDRLFAENVTTKPSGHGYGLMTCARIVRSHGGTIEANSAPGEGTVFTIRFPSDAAA